MNQNTRNATNLAVQANVPLTLLATEALELLTEIDHLTETLNILKNEIEDAQLIDLNYREARDVRRDLLRIVQEGLKGAK